MAGSRRKRIVRVAMVKALAKWGDVQANVRMLERLAEPLKVSKVDVLITPECFLDGYMVRRMLKKISRQTRAELRACSVNGPSDPIIRRVARVAKLLGCYVVVGASEKGRGPRVRNAAYLLDRNGGHVGSYYKVMPCDYYEAGNDLPVFRTDFGTVGILICADRRWPENMRCLRLKGAEIILNPTWGAHGEGNTQVMTTRAYENGIPVCFAHPKQAMICLPGGVADMATRPAAILESNRPGVLVHDIDLSDNPKAKKTKNTAGSHPVQNRRPELYGIIGQRG